ncbi:MAG: replicative DNA helicase [Planctomycetes bacterium]|nr:replicative DNA helicase [Planctomycetota bacterium]NOG54688.1 replicative DNA helicase [Planctomycetota bacterium]
MAGSPGSGSHGGNGPGSPFEQEGSEARSSGGVSASSVLTGRGSQIWRSENLSKLFDRLPPNALETEMALLGAMIIDAQVIGDVIQFVRSPDDFWKPAHGHIFKALLDLYDQHNAGDIAMLYQLLVDRGVAESIGGPDYLEELAASTPVSINAPHHARIVSEKATLRRLIDAAAQILHAAHTQADDIQLVLDQAEKLVFDVVERTERGGPQALVQLLQETMERIQSHDGRLVTGVPTAYREFDEYTCGLQKGDMLILAARPSMGKTALALNIAENVALLGNPVGMFSLEMSRQQLVQRLLCSNAEVDSHRLRRNMLRKEELDRLSMAVAQLSEAPIYIDDTPGISILELRARGRRMAAQHGVKFIIIDYLQLMRGMSRESRQQEVSEISRGVKALARELDVPVLCLSQLNRAAENREDHRPRLADLRESGSIEQDADVVMMLHREDRYRTDESEHDNTAELIIAKQRNGPTGTVDLTWVGSNMKFKDHSSASPPPGSGGDWAPPPRKQQYRDPSEPTHGQDDQFDRRDEPTDDYDDGIPI